MAHGRNDLAPLEKLLPPCAGLVVGVPVETINEGHAFGDVETERVNVRDEYQERNQRPKTCSAACLTELMVSHSENPCWCSPSPSGRYSRR